MDGINYTYTFCMYMLSAVCLSYVQFVRELWLFCRGDGSPTGDSDAGEQTFSMTDLHMWCTIIVIIAAWFPYYSASHLGMVGGYHQDMFRLRELSVASPGFVPLELVPVTMCFEKWSLWKDRFFSWCFWKLFQDVRVRNDERWTKRDEKWRNRWRMR